MHINRDGRPLAFSSRQSISGGEVQIDGEVDKSGLVTVTSNSAGSIQEQSFQWDTEALMPEGLRLLMRATELNPKLSMAHLYLGYICKDEGNEKEAQRRFERAIQCNPNCTEALRELRLMNMRKVTPDKEKKSLFGKIFR